jgi:hypothetical protein
VPSAEVPAECVVWPEVGEVGLPWARHWWFVGCIRLVGSLGLKRSRSFDVTGLEGGLVCGRWSLCWWRSATREVPAGWAEERQASPGNHRPGWRCVGRRAIAKDSSRRTCCVAEANAGGRRSDEGVGGDLIEQAKAIA